MPTREGYEVALTAQTAGGDWEDVRSRTVFSSDRQRPLVFENDAGQPVSVHAVGITPPVVLDAGGGDDVDSVIDASGVGGMTGRFRVAVARKDSAGLIRYSELSNYSSELDLAENSIEITDLSVFLGEEATDQYDQLVIALFPVELGEWKVIDSVSIGTGSYTIDVLVDDIKDNDTIVPGFNLVFPAVKCLDALNNGGARRLVGAVMGAWSPFTDMPLLVEEVPVAKLTEDGILEFDVDLSAYKDGTYVIRGIETDNGNEVGRAFIGTDAAGGGEFLQLYADFARVTTLKGDVNMPAADQTWQIRKQVTGAVVAGSRRISLSEEVAEQWMVWQSAVIGALGSQEIYKVSSAEADAPPGLASLNMADTVGTDLILASGWTGSTGTDFFELRPDNRSIWFGMASADRWEGTASALRLSVEGLMCLALLGRVKGLLCAVCEAKELFLLEFDTIVDPVNAQQSVAFNIALYVDLSKRVTSFSCVSPFSGCATADESLIWIGAEGLYMFDSQEVFMLTQDAMRERWNAFDSASLTNARVVFDPMHVFSPVIRAIGMGVDYGGVKPSQLAYVPNRGDWLNFSDQMENMDAGCLVTTQNGQQRVLVGGNSRLWLYGAPARPGSDTPADKYGFPKMPGDIQGTESVRPYTAATMNGAWVDNGDGTYNAPVASTANIAVGTFYQITDTSNGAAEIFLGECTAILAGPARITLDRGGAAAPTVTPASGDLISPVGIEGLIGLQVTTATGASSGTAPSIIIPVAELSGVTIGTKLVLLDLSNGFKPVFAGEVTAKSASSGAGNVTFMSTSGDAPDVTVASGDRLYLCADFCAYGDGYAFTNAGIRVAHIGADNVAQEGTILYGDKWGSILFVQPDNAEWSFASTNAPYRYIVGVRRSIWRVPTIRSEFPNALIELDEFSLEIEDSSSFEWVCRLIINGSANNPTLSDDPIADMWFSRSDLINQFTPTSLQIGSDYKFSAYFAFYAPADSHLYLKEAKFGITERGDA